MILWKECLEVERIDRLTRAPRKLWKSFYCHETKMQTNRSHPKAVQISRPPVWETDNSITHDGWREILVIGSFVAISGTDLDPIVLGEMPTDVVEVVVVWRQESVLRSSVPLGAIPIQTFHRHDLIRIQYRGICSSSTDAISTEEEALVTTDWQHSTEVET